MLNEVRSKTLVNIPNVRRLQLLKVDFEVIVVEIVGFKYICYEGVSHVVVSTKLYCLVLNTLEGLKQRLD